MALAEIISTAVYLIGIVKLSGSMYEKSATSLTVTSLFFIYMLVLLDYVIIRVSMHFSSYTSSLQSKLETSFFKLRYLAFDNTLYAFHHKPRRFPQRFKCLSYNVPSTRLFYLLLERSFRIIFVLWFLWLLSLKLLYSLTGRWEITEGYTSQTRHQSTFIIAAMYCFIFLYCRFCQILCEFSHWNVWTSLATSLLFSY